MMPPPPSTPSRRVRSASMLLPTRLRRGAFCAVAMDFCRCSTLCKKASSSRAALGPGLFQRTSTPPSRFAVEVRDTDGGNGGAWRLGIRSAPMPRFCITILAPVACSQLTAGEPILSGNVRNCSGDRLCRCSGDKLCRCSGEGSFCNSVGAAPAGRLIDP